MTIFLSFLKRFFGGNAKPAYELADIYTGLRQQVLELDADQLGALKDKPVWVILMETGYSEAAVTLVAVADGTTSLYFSNGGGIIGTGAHKKVRAASLGFVKLAEKFLPQMKKTQQFPVPKPGMTCFYVVTPQGVLTYTAKEDDLGEKRDKLSQLFHAGHEVIGRMRIVDQSRQSQQDRRPDR